MCLFKLDVWSEVDILYQSTIVAVLVRPVWRIEIVTRLTRAWPRIEDFVGAIRVVVMCGKDLKDASWGMGWIAFMWDMITDIIG